MFCWHRWAKWGDAFREYAGGNFQARKCEKCGKTQVRKIVSLWRAHVDAGQITSSVESVGSLEAK